LPTPTERHARARVGDLLREARVEAQKADPALHAAEFARRVGFAPETWSRWENHRVLPSDENLWTLAKGLGLRYDVLKTLKEKQTRRRE
jgi:transcriptional regulator with XRE-family HTH domain